MSERPRLSLLDRSALADTIARSRESARQRANLNLHPTLDDPIQRFVNVFQPDTYVRPHRHEGDRFELFVVLQGRAGLLLFDDAGRVTDRAVLEPSATSIAESRGGVWHTLVALVPDTVTFELKPGPYHPIADKDFASWAPREGDPAAAGQLARWKELFS